MDEINVVSVPPKQERVAMFLRIPEDLKDFVENTAHELGYNVNEYVTKVFTSIMGDRDEQ